MIDFHNHVLYGVDDGPELIEESMDMVKEAANQGITDIVQTVHFQHPKMDGKNTSYDFLNSRLGDLQKEINKASLNVKLHLSAEVFYLPNLIEILDNPLVTIGNRKYMLIEFKTNISPIDYENQFYKLQLKGISPIIAHPERYRFVQNDINILKLWIERGYYIQLDAGSIIGNFGVNTKKIAINMIEKNLVHIIGSDAHNNKKRNFCLAEAYDYLEKIKSKNYVDALKMNVKKLLNGDQMLNIDFGFKKNSSSNMINKIFKLIREL